MGFIVLLKSMVWCFHQFWKILSTLWYCWKLCSASWPLSLMFAFRSGNCLKDKVAPKPWLNSQFPCSSGPTSPHPKPASPHCLWGFPKALKPIFCCSVFSSSQQNVWSNNLVGHCWEWISSLSICNYCFLKLEYMASL